MRHFLTFILLSVFSGHIFAQDMTEFNSLSPLNSDLDHPEDERLIEPTSPILGKNLVAKIRKDPRHPEVILESVKRENPFLLRDIQLSSLAYFRTLSRPLKTYCSTAKKEEANDKAIDVVETAAIPIEILRPLHESYIEQLTFLRSNYVETLDEEIQDTARKAAIAYQQERYNCDVVQQLNQMETKVKRYLPKRLKRLVDLHHKISSPEAAFPRIQFSINGFTQYVFGELLKVPHDRLAGLLKVIYEEQVEWIKKRDKNEPVERYFSSFENKALRAGYLPREILLVLAYSTRNMPSLDVHYGYDTEKALLLETYFWKFHDHRDYVTKKYEHDIFPNAIMKRNPGLYHYATSALMACDVRLHGYSGAMSRIIALGNKVGYKVHKLLTEIAGKEGKKSLKEIRETAKRQAFGPGVDAGKFGGSHGLRFCRNTPKENWLKNEKESDSSEYDEEYSELLEAEDLDPELEEAIQ